jgi:predicted lipoprotein with Yx(FWY)xxD motif
VLPGSAASTDMAMITRPDGGEQWTYKGHPLYTFAGDGSADQTNGDNIPDFGGHWHVARPASAGTPPPEPPPHCTGYDC